MPIQPVKNVMRRWTFTLIELVMRPFQKLARSRYASRVRRYSIPGGISGTADVPLVGRMVMHQAGTRPDEAAVRMAPHLPSMSRVIVASFGAAGLASRWSGYRPASVVYPAIRPSTRDSMIAHRTEFFDRSLAEATDADKGRPVRQVVVLGAGWDSRAYGSLSGARVRFFEVDMAPTLAAKKLALARAGIAADHVTFIETELNQTSWLQALTERGFDPTAPTFILWEGVTMYLDDEAVGATLRQVARLAPGTRIAFDYWSRELLRAEAPFEQAGRTVHASMEFYGESFTFGISTKAPSRGHVERLVTYHGLELGDYEPMGPDDQVHGGLAIALCRR